MSFLDKWNRIDIVIDIDYEYLLIGALGLVGMDHYIQDIAILDMHDYLFEGNPTRLFPKHIFIIIPSVRNHGVMLVQCVPFGNRDDTRRRYSGMWIFRKETGLKGMVRIVA